MSVESGQRAAGLQPVCAPAEAAVPLLRFSKPQIRISEFVTNREKAFVLLLRVPYFSYTNVGLFL